MPESALKKAIIARRGAISASKSFACGVSLDVPGRLSFDLGGHAAFFFADRVGLKVKL